jgi:hypothetical protein
LIAARFRSYLKVPQIAQWILPANRQQAVTGLAFGPVSIGIIQKAPRGTVMQQFVAITDDELFRKDGLPGPLVPYQCGVSCWHQLRDSLPPPRADMAHVVCGVAEGVALSA